MPSKTSKPPSRPSAPADAFDDYLLEGDLSDNPFGSPSPKPSSNKRKSSPSNALGIDEEVSIKKRAVVPRVKLDEARLLSDAGIPKLRSRAKKLHLKGKGHEWSDAQRLLSMYQIWLDDLFPKAKFLDALAMVEKAGHKGAMHKARMGWIEEGKPRDKRFDDEDDAFGRDNEGAEKREPTRIAPIFEKAKSTAAAAAGERQGVSKTTPDREDLFGDEDIYDVTPRAKRTVAPAGGEPDEDDLDALMAEAESAPGNSIFGGGKPARSLFGGPIGTAASRRDEPGEEDDLDALMAEAESVPVNNNFGEGKPQVPVKVVEEEDDLEALIAEVEAGEASSKPVTAEAGREKAAEGDGGPKDSFADEEEAMAEMEGLW